MGMLSAIKILGNLKFFSHGLTLGTKEFSGKYSDKDRREQRTEDLVAVPSVIPPWFKPAEIPNFYHQDACDKIGKEFKDFHDAMIDAVRSEEHTSELQSRFDLV